MEIRESAIATRCSVLNLHGVHSTNFIPNLKARYKMSSFHFCERCLHSTADVDTMQTETVKVLEIKSDRILHKVTYHILYSLRAQVTKFAVDLYLVLVDSCSVFINVFINLT